MEIHLRPSTKIVTAAVSIIFWLFFHPVEVLAQPTSAIITVTNPGIWTTKFCLPDSNRQLVYSFSDSVKNGHFSITSISFNVWGSATPGSDYDSFEVYRNTTNAMAGAGFAGVANPQSTGSRHFTVNLITPDTLDDNPAHGRPQVMYYFIKTSIPQGAASGVTMIFSDTAISQTQFGPPVPITQHQYPPDTCTIYKKPPRIQGDSLFCKYGTVNFTDSLSGGTWGLANTTVASITVSGTVTALSGGADSVFYTDNGTGCSTFFPFNVANVTAVSVTNIPDTVVFCSGTGDTITLHTQLNAPNINYTWASDTVHIDSADVYTQPDSSVLSFYSVNRDTAAKNKTFVVTPHLSGCASVPDTFHVTVMPVPQVQHLTDSLGYLGFPFLCTGTAIYPQHFVGVPNYTQFRWAHVDTSVAVTYVPFFGAQPDTLPMSGSNSLPKSIVFWNKTHLDAAAVIADTPVIIAGSVTCYGKPVLDSIHVHPKPDVYPLSQLDTDLTGDTVCASGTTQTLTFDGLSNGTIYSWTVQKSPSCTVSLPVLFGTTDFIPSFTYQNTATGVIDTIRISVTPIITNGTLGYPCSGTTEAARITVYPKPTLQPITSKYICNRAADTISCAPLNTDLITNWFKFVYTDTATITDTNTTQLDFSSGDDYFSYVANYSGTSPGLPYRIKIIPSINNVCFGDTVIVKDTVSPTPNVVPLSDTVVCAGSNYKVVFGDTNGIATSFSYSIFKTTPSPVTLQLGIDSFVRNIVAPTDSVKDTFYVRVIPNIRSCYGQSDTNRVIVIPTPKLKLAGTEICNLDTFRAVNLNNSGSYIKTFVDSSVYSWHIYGSDHLGLSFTDTGTAMIPAAVGVNNTVNALTDTLIVIANISACTSIDTVKLTVDPTPTMRAAGPILVCNHTGIDTISFDTLSNVMNTVYTWKSIFLNHILVTVDHSVNIDSAQSPFPAINAFENTSDSNAVILLGITARSGVCYAHDTEKIIIYPTAHVPKVTGGFYNYGQNVSPQTIAVSNPNNEWFVIHNDSLHTFTVGLGQSDTVSNSDSLILPGFVALNTAGGNEIGVIKIVSFIGGCIGDSVSFNDTLAHITQVTVTNANDAVCSGTVHTAIKLDAGVPNIRMRYRLVNLNSATPGLSIGLADSFSVDSVIAPFSVSNTSNFKLTDTFVVTPFSFFSSGDSIAGYPDTFTVSVMPVPVVRHITDTFYCDGAATSPIVFTGPTDPSLVTYKWMNSNTGLGLGSVNDDGTIPSFTISDTSELHSSEMTIDYTAVILLDSLNYCAGNSDSMKIAVYPKPKLSPVAQVTICSSGSLTHVVHCESDTFGVSPNCIWHRDTSSLNLSPVSISDSGVVIHDLVSNSDTGQMLLVYNYSYTVHSCTTVGRITDTVNPILLLKGVDDTVICNKTPYTRILASSTSGCTFAWARDTAVSGISNPAASGSGSVRTETVNNITGNATVVVRYVDTVFYKQAYYTALSQKVCSNIVSDTVRVRASPSLTVHKDAVCSETPVYFIDVHTTTIDTPKRESVSWLVANQGYGHIKVYFSPGNGNNANASLGDSSIISRYITSENYNYFDTLRFAFTLIDTAGGIACTNRDTFALTVKPRPAQPVISYLQLPAMDTVALGADRSANDNKVVLYRNMLNQNFTASVPADTSNLRYTWAAVNETTGIAFADSLDLRQPDTLFRKNVILSFRNAGDVTIRDSAWFLNGEGCTVVSSVPVTVWQTTPPVNYLPIVVLSTDTTPYSLICLDAGVDSSYLWGYDDATLMPHLLYYKAVDASHLQVNQDMTFDGTGYYPNGDSIAFGDTAKYSFWVQTSSGTSINGNTTKIVQKTYYNHAHLAEKPFIPAPAGQTSSVLRVFPNPAIGAVMFSLSDTGTGQVTFQIIGSNGRMADVVASNINSFFYDCSRLPPDTYMVLCLRNNVIITSTKFIKQQ
jgi:hypothetical protein